MHISIFVNYVNRRVVLIFPYNLWPLKTVKYYCRAHVNLQVKKTAVLYPPLYDGQLRRSCTVLKQPRVYIRLWLQPVMFFPSLWCYGKSPALKIPSLILNPRKRYSFSSSYTCTFINFTDFSAEPMINIFRDSKAKSLSTLTCERRRWEILMILADTRNYTKRRSTRGGWLVHCTTLQRTDDNLLGTRARE